MHKIQSAINELIKITETEMNGFLERLSKKEVKKGTYLSRPGKISDEIYFVNSGLLRLLIINEKGDEITIHFTMENQFLADYSSFILQEPATYFIQTLEDAEIIIIPKSAIHWGYSNIKEGEKLGRLIAEHYFIYQDNRVKDMYARSPKQRYEKITEVFPNIHNRVPQHMIASYLGISSVHLSRLKKPTI